MKNLKIKFRPLTFGEEVSDTRNEAIQRQTTERRGSNEKRDFRVENDSPSVGSGQALLG